MPLHITNSFYTQWCFMRTNIVIDDELMANALKVSGLRTKKDAVEEGECTVFLFI